MDQVPCPSCKKKLPERGRYCPNCAAQVRCTVCREILEPGANACVECGALLDISNSELATNGKLHSAPGLNHISYEETETSRSLNAEFTDTAVDSLSGPLASALTGRPYGQVPRQLAESTTRPTGPDVAQLGIPAIQQGPIADAADYVVVDEAIETNSAATTPSGYAESDQKALGSIFRRDGDKVVLDDTQLKATSKTNAVRRLTYLALYFHKLNGEASVSKETLLSIVKDAGWYDQNNTSKVFNNTADLSVTGEQVSLRSTGRQKAKEFLADLGNPAVESSWTLGSSTRRTRSGKSSANQETVSTKTTTATRRATPNEPKKVGVWLEAYKGLPNQPSHKLLSEKSVAEQGMVALWGIRKATGNVDKVVSTYLLASFILSAFEIKVDRGNLGNQLRKKTAEVIHMRGTNFQLNQTGMDYVDHMLNQGS